MRLLVPFTVRDPRVAAALPPWAEWHDVSADNHAYWRSMSSMWWQGTPASVFYRPDDLMVVEHDVEIHDTVLEQFERCPEPWCVFGYSNMCHPECNEAWANMLGCTRFRKELIEACPDALSGIPEDQRDWHNLCDSIAGDKVGGMPAPLRPGSLRAAGFKHHWHTPFVHHISWEGHAR